MPGTFIGILVYLCNRLIKILRCSDLSDQSHGGNGRKCIFSWHDEGGQLLGGDVGCLGVLCGFPHP